jgi:DNA-binding XRE family transcriptional regulator
LVPFLLIFLGKIFNFIMEAIMVAEMKYDSGLRQLRECIGMTRKQMAELVGCSEVAIKRIEYGTLSPSLDLMDQITAKTGCVLQHKNGHWDVLCVDITDGKEYSKESFSRWQEITAKDVTSTYAKVWFRHMLNDITQALLYAAGLSKNMGKLYAAFGRALCKIILESDIGPIFFQRLRDLSEEHSPLMAKAWKDYILLPFDGNEKFPIKYRKDDINGTLSELFAMLFTASRVQWTVYSTRKRLPENLQSSEEIYEGQFGKDSSCNPGILEQKEEL